MIGNYDVVAGIGFDEVDEIVSGLYKSYAIPHDIAIPTALDQQERTGLLLSLGKNLTGLPQHPALGNFQVTKTPSLHEVATTPYVMVTLPFSLSFQNSQNAADATVLSGDLYFPAVCGATVRDGALVFSVSAPPIRNPPQDLPSPSLRASASSAVQPSSPEAAATVASSLATSLGHFLLNSIVVSPVISIPLSSKAGSAPNPLVDVRTSTNQDMPVGPVPAILAGVQFPGAGKPAPMPEALLALKTTNTANLYVWVVGAAALPYDARLRAGGAATLISHAPIERTELVPAASQMTTSFANSVLAVTAFLKFSQDENDRFVYARFLATPSVMLSATPLRATTVQLCDLDDPAPAHDDAKIPKTGTSTRTTGKSITTTTVTFEPPTANEVLGTAVTDWDGRAIFVLRPGAGTFAGNVTTKTDVQPFGGGPGSDSSTQEIVVETYPDLFFQVSASLLETDTLKMPNGLFVNYSGKRLGAPATPVTYTFIRQPENNPGTL